MYKETTNINAFNLFFFNLNYHVHSFSYLLYLCYQEYLNYLVLKYIAEKKTWCVYFT